MKWRLRRELCDSDERLSCDEQENDAEKQRARTARSQLPSSTEINAEEAEH